MGAMKSFITEKTIRLNEDIFEIDGDVGRIKISASSVRKGEVRRMMEEGKGLRIIVGAGQYRDLLVVWVGDSNSNVGAMHDTVASQFGLSMHDDPHVPLEMTPRGQLRVTTTAQAQFDDAREVEDVLDRNREFRKIFGTSRIDMSRLQEW